MGKVSYGFGGSLQIGEGQIVKVKCDWNSLPCAHRRDPETRRCVLCGMDWRDVVASGSPAVVAALNSSPGDIFVSEPEELLPALQSARDLDWIVMPPLKPRRSWLRRVLAFVFARKPNRLHEPPLRSRGTYKHPGKKKP